MIHKFKEMVPKIHPTAFIQESAQVIGDVEIGDHSSIWFHTVVRGDVHYIRIGDYTNIQDLSVVHVTQGTHPAVIGSYVTVGHNVVIHGCTIGDYCLLGMGSIILDGAEIGPNCVIAAGSLVPPGFQSEPGTLIMGHPAKTVRPLREKEKQMIAVGWEHYRDLAKEYQEEIGSNYEL